MHPLSDIWWHLFVNRTDGCLRHFGDGWRHAKRQLTIEELDRALSGRQSLGIDATDADGLSRWLCLDADDEDGRRGLHLLAHGLNPDTSLFEISRRGAHLWWFCPPTPWHQVRATGLALAGRRGISCEVFPKSSGRNGVRVPLTPHPKTGEIYPVVDPNTGELRSVDGLQHLTVQELPNLESPSPRPVHYRRWPDRYGDFAELLAEVERHTSVRQYGPERAIGRCPFHDDRRPSLSLLGGFWRCWAGCGEGGIGAFRARIGRMERR